MLTFLAVMFTFLSTCALVGLPLWWAARCITRHLQSNSAAAKAVVDHLIAPLFHGQPPQEKRPDARGPEELTP